MTSQQLHRFRQADDLTLDEMLAMCAHASLTIGVKDGSYTFRIGDEIGGFRGHYETQNFDEGVEWLFQKICIERA